ncbi:hypothetical protein [Streptomyces sp. SID3343]|nr:hypothetical protein [Streptomyces sp. SID3343]MYV96829.1 hypothetical protein [Streptomyces sp. SID3343]
MQPHAGDMAGPLIIAGAGDGFLMVMVIVTVVVLIGCGVMWRIRNKR